MSSKWLQRFARGIGAFWGVFWVLSLIASGIGEISAGEYQGSWEGIALAGLIAAEVVGVVVAWRKEKIGGTIITVTAIILCVFAYFSAGRRKWFAVLVSGVPFLISGILFLLASRRSRVLSSAQQESESSP